MKRSTLAMLLLTVCFSHAVAQEANTLTQDEKDAGWVSLFDGQSIKGWRCFKKKDADGWGVERGAIVQLKAGAGDLVTEKEYANFEFHVQWMFTSGNNSGIIYRFSEKHAQPWLTGPEMQITPQRAGDTLGKMSGGALYDLFAPSENPFTSKDDWTSFKVLCDGKRIQHFINGLKVVDTVVGSDGWNDALAQSKFKGSKIFASLPSGYIALQDHGAKIMFRSIKIRVLPDTK